MSITELEHPNEGLLRILKQMSKDYAVQGDQTRARSYNTAVSSLRAFNERIIGTSGKKVVFENETVKVSGIGDKILAKIQTYLDTGDIPQAKILHDEVTRSMEEKQSRKTSKDRVLDQFQAIYRVGEKKALELWEAGYHSLDDLRRNPGVLHEASSAYLESYDDLQLRMKRDYIFIFEIVLHLLIRKRFGSNYKMMIAGSYARGSLDSGDVDVLIESRDFTLQELTEYLVDKDVIVRILLLGHEKMHAIAQCPTGLWHKFRLDIHFVLDPSSWAASVLYFTSGIDFNRWIRGIAARQGLTLSDKGLFDKDGNMIQTPTENDIFGELGQKRVAIQDRG